ncbi:MAG: 2-C-methyl-D-erythritol 2,4-cyclodiphosphate synthase [Planctomycetota bacterium]|nr:2-C-methyl-D-erythritol 2,4-cyclodiphosphate synthase [Planctomycetota bacterium]MEC8336877.1 2-C-methyl-D-erythritol 2,4-cyclodiphosphate synthase [Planctomycetota bacterium]
MGHDTHRLGPGSALRLGGVNLPHDRSLIGHSDADVLLHALIDALLGAAALGDIGQIFPNTDIKNADRDSVEMLQEVVDHVHQAEYRIVNVDCILFAERPKIAPVALDIRRSIAAILSVLPEAVGVKAKTGEGVGPIGREEAISAQVVALLEKTS